MATMNDIRTWLTSNNKKFEIMDDGELRFLWGFEDGRSQLGFLYQANDFLVARSPIGPYTAAKADAIFKAVAQGTSGPFGVSVDPDCSIFFLMVAMPLLNLDENELALAIEALPMFADEMEKAVFGVDTF